MATVNKMAKEEYPKHLAESIPVNKISEEEARKQAKEDYDFEADVTETLCNNTRVAAELARSKNTFEEIHRWPEMTGSGDDEHRGSDPESVSPRKDNVTPDMKRLAAVKRKLFKQPDNKNIDETDGSGAGMSLHYKFYTFSLEDFYEQHNDIIDKDITEILIKLDAMETEPRDVKLVQLRSWILDLNYITKYFLKKVFKKEMQHILGVRIAMDRTYTSFTGSLTNPNKHDHSKDEITFILTTMSYNFANSKFSRTPLLKKLTALELIHHYKAEMHHEQREDLTDDVLTKIDIAEMAIDRMNRALGASADKEINWNTLFSKYAPKFSVNYAARLTQFRGACATHESATTIGFFHAYRYGYKQLCQKLNFPHLKLM